MQDEFSLPGTRLYIDTYQVDVRLRRLGGLRREYLIESALHGDRVRRSTHHLEFPGAPAYRAASSGLMALRVSTAESLGWHHGDYLGIPVAYSPDEVVAIAVTEGNENVGLLTDQDPRTRALKGGNTVKATDTNRLFDDPEVSFWYLLTYSSEEGLFVELSSPSQSESGHVVGWDERILVGEVRGGATAARIAPPSSMSPAPAIVEVHRKQA
ncbi:MAG: hypothetical protein ACHQFZ_04280 [Acidimicrobiales bacterium]